MPFNFRLFLRIVARAFSDRLGPAGLPSSARLALLPFLLAGWGLLNLVHRLCWRLDDILFPGYRSLGIERPLFIVGVQRSGTTFLHRLLADDRETFTAIRTWEIVLAPSILQKRLLQLVDRLDTFLGQPLLRLYGWLKERYPDPLAGIHEVDLFKPEEDEYLHTWCFASLFLAELFPYPDMVAQYARFDDEIPGPERKALMEFYRGCVQRHMYVFGNGRRFLSKNPAFCGKLESIDRAFPDATLVVTVRSPLETVPSYLSLLAAMHKSVEGPRPDPQASVEGSLGMLDHFNQRPLELADHLFRGRSLVVPYPRLMAELEAVVGEIYVKAGLDQPPAFAARLRNEAAASRGYRSPHRYSLAPFGLTRKVIVSRYRAVFDRFRFETGD